MCGIAGLIAPPGGPPPDDHRLAAMNAAMVHRGPDDEGRGIEGAVGLAMRRLSIIDLAGGHQPIANEDGTVRVVLNGEIYNHAELRSELEARGHRFRTHCDTEVLVHLWEEDGPDLLARLDGMFAFALHDSRRDLVMLARDHAGIKPLFVADTPGGGLAFASEIKCLFASGLVPAELDVDALGQLLAWEYVPGARTIARGVRRLEAGHRLLVSVGSGPPRLERWWDIPAPAADSAPGTGEDDAAAVERIGAILDASVRRQLVADVPLGAFLSGGVDSSLIVSAMPRGTRTYSIGFDEAGYDERRWAAMVAEHLGLDHSVDVLAPDAAALFDRLMPHMDDPIGDFSIFPTFLVSQHARRTATVALSGDGGDELFGGYETYLAGRAGAAIDRLPVGLVRTAGSLIRRLRPSARKKGIINSVRRFAEGFDHDPGLGHCRWRIFAGEAMLGRLLTPDAAGQRTTGVDEHVRRLAARAADRSPLDRALYVDFHSYLVDNCLVKVDRMSMATSLEVRVPFLSPPVIEAAFALPPRLKVAGRRTKVLLKRLAAQRVPRAAVYRRKQGFSIPLKTWLGTSLRERLEDLLDPAALAADGVLDAGAVRALVDEHLAGRENHSHVLWTLMVARDWQRRWTS